MISSLRHIGDSDLQKLLEDARRSPRRRSHLLLHEGHHDGVQRLLIAVQPGTYVRPHHHSEQWEMLVLLQGRLDVLEMDESGAVLARHRMDEQSPLIQIPQSAWHACVAKSPDTLVLEVKPGPYRPNEFAAWAPEESSPGADAMREQLENAASGSRLASL